MSEELLKVLGSEERVKAAIAHLMFARMNEDSGKVEVRQAYDTAVGHLEMVIDGRGQFNAALDGGLAEKFPELLAANEAAAASKLNGTEQTTT